MDHLKPLYTQDLKVIEELGLLKVGKGEEGCLIVADNMIKPGNPKYHRYVNSSVDEKKADIGKPEKLEACEEKGVKGDPGYVYESKFIESWEPQGVKDAIEVTRVVGKV